MPRLINETQVRKTLFAYCEHKGYGMKNPAPNELRRKNWGSCEGEPKLYTQISPEVIEEVDARVRLILQEIVDRNSAGKAGQTIL